MNQQKKDRKLIELLVSAPSQGMAQAIREYGGAVKTICRTILSGFSEQDIEEAAADSFVALWKNIQNYDLKRDSSLKNYLYGIARHIALNRRRSLSRRKEEQEDPLLDSGMDVQLWMEQRENQQIVRQTVAGMEPPDRDIFILRYFYGMAVKEIADRLRLEPKFVENRLYRCKASLRRQLSERGINR